jgi:hypothetical protein
MNWERMTPELPRAPSRAARATESTISSRPISSIEAPWRGGRAPRDGPEGEGHVVPGVAVGDREDVEVVDLGPTGLQGAEGALDDAAEPDEAGIDHKRRGGG